jgi:hypothetical protein
VVLTQKTIGVQMSRLVHDVVCIWQLTTDSGYTVSCGRVRSSFSG